MPVHHRGIRRVPNKGLPRAGHFSGQSVTQRESRGVVQCCGELQPWVSLPKRGARTATLGRKRPGVVSLCPELGNLHHHPTHPFGLPLLQPDQRRRLEGQHRHEGVERNLAQSPDTVGVQASGLLERLEDTLNGLPLGVQVRPFLGVPADRPGHPKPKLR